MALIPSELCHLLAQVFFPAPTVAPLIDDTRLRSSGEPALERNSLGAAHGLARHNAIGCQWSLFRRTCDRISKFADYQACNTLEVYMLVSQFEKLVEVYQCRNHWQQELFRSGQTIHLDREPPNRSTSIDQRRLTRCNPSSCQSEE